MKRLGYTRYVAQGGDVGAGVTDVMAIQARRDWPASTSTSCSGPLSRWWRCSSAERRSPRGSPTKNARRRGVRGIKQDGLHRRDGQAPQTIGYALTDSPAGLAAWMLDHDADSY